MNVIKRQFNNMIWSILMRVQWMIFRIGLYIWELPLLKKPHMILSLFYILLTPILMYLYFNYDGQFGLRQLESLTHISWAVWVTIFSVTAWIVSNSTQAYVYALSVIPIVIYAIAILASIDEIGNLGILPVLYLAFLSLLFLSSIRLRYEANILITRVLTLDHKIKALEERVIILHQSTPNKKHNGGING